MIKSVTWHLYHGEVLPEESHHVPFGYDLTYAFDTTGARPNHPAAEAASQCEYTPSVIGVMMRDQYVAKLEIAVLQKVNDRLRIARIDHADSLTISLSDGPDIVVREGVYRMNRVEHVRGSRPKTP